MPHVKPEGALDYQEQLDIIRWRIQFLSVSIQRLSEKLEQGEDYPTETPSKLCQLIKIAIEVLTIQLDNIDSSQLTKVYFILCQVSEHLRYVERSRIENTPWSMIQATEHFLKKQVCNGYHFIIRPQWNHNYGIIGDFVESYKSYFYAFPELQDSFEKKIGELSNEKLYCISFPRIDRLNCLLHVNWGHEVGHILVSHWTNSKFRIKWDAKLPSIRARIEKDVRDRFNGLPVPDLFKEYAIQQEISDKINETEKVAENGLTELLCDTIGLYLFGPAALAALRFTSAPHQLDENPLDCGYYPPWRYRLRLMLKECVDIDERTVIIDGNDCKYPIESIHLFYEWLNTTQKITAIETDKDELKARIASKEAYDFIEDNWTSVRKEILALIPSESVRYCLHENISIIEGLVIRLNQNIPPNEVGEWPNTKYASFENILNAAWIFVIQNLQKNEGWGTADDFEKAFRLVLKAIEASFVHETYGAQLQGLE